jgi:pimeloyl-ACP methyl ester carboxylesterase
VAVSRFVTANGIRLHYLDYNESAKPGLMCIHGLTGNAHNFDPLAPHLTEGYHVMSLDIRGRGESGWGPPTYYVPLTYVSDLAAMLDACRIRRVTLIGTSMGGIISMMFAGGYPERVERLILNDIGPEIDPVGLARINDYVANVQSDFKDMADVAAYHRQIYPPMAAIPEAQLIELVKWSVKPTGNGRLTWKMDPAIRRPPRVTSAARQMDLWVPYARIAAPVLIVRGAESDILARATAARMCNVLRNAKLVEVPGVGHAPSLVEAEALSAIKEFLAR